MSRVSTFGAYFEWPCPHDYLRVTELTVTTTLRRPDIAAKKAEARSAPDSDPVTKSARTTSPADPNVSAEKE